METIKTPSTDNQESADLQKKLDAAEAAIAELEADNKRLRKELTDLQSRKSADDETDDFTKGSGVLWKRNRSGGYESVPYCPTCKSTLADYSGSLLCLTCNWQAPIKSFEAPKVYHDLFGGK